MGARRIFPGVGKFIGLDMIFTFFLKKVGDFLVVALIIQAKTPTILFAGFNTAYCCCNQNILGAKLRFRGQLPPSALT